MGIGHGLIKLIDLYSTLLIVRVLLTWVPNIKWDAQPFYFLRQISDVYLNQFRKIIPPIEMLDISPFVAFIVLSIIRNLLVYIFVFVVFIQNCGNH